MDSVQEMPPYNIKEPRRTYDDGSPRDDGVYLQEDLYIRARSNLACSAIG